MHRTRIKVFAGDDKALSAARSQINDGYLKNKYVSDEEAIKAVSSSRCILKLYL